MSNQYTATIPNVSEKSLQKITKKLSLIIHAPLIIGLSGRLGCGKTTFVRYFCQSLGSKDWVNSPTYSIIQSYTSTKFNIVHIDLYRCHSEQDIDRLDIPSLYRNNTILIIEWIDRTSLIKADITIHLDFINKLHRSLTLSSDTEAWIKDVPK